MKRLYVGGLGHTVSEKDLRDRFGKFGEVSDVEIITRKDEHGSPLKTFGYINISISDSDYKRCMTVLNKSKWKGGTLQIELAKESFLHRLAEERQKATEKAHTPRTDPQEKIVESFKAAGVENFHMKAAVPGTEVPGHKNWVVSKFGRVLPVLQLKGQGRNKVFKYDPSKHCHNIKKLDAGEDVTPVAELTWEVDGGYDDISKKRRGEFPPQKKTLKKTRKDSSVGTENRTSAQTRGEGLSAKQAKPTPPVRKPVSVLDSDADSEDEIRMLVAQERSQIRKAASAEEEEDNLEVVADDFVVKSNAFWAGENGARAHAALTSSKSDEEYDSADTDEILTRSKTPGKAEEADFEDLSENSFDRTSNGGVKEAKKKGRDAAEPGPESDNSDESSSESGDSDYEALMGNCYRLDLNRTSTQTRGEGLSAKQAKPTPPVRKPVSVLHSDADSEDEIRMLVAQERSQIRKAASAEGEEEEDNLEVVADDFVVKSNTFWAGENGARAPAALTSSKSDEEYDSADTDEILTRGKTPAKAEEADFEDLSENSFDRTSNGGVQEAKKKGRDAAEPGPESDNSDESSSESGDSDYEALMGNCYRLDLSLADLETLAKNAEEMRSDGDESEPRAGPSELLESSSTSKTSPPKKTGYNPEDILASLLGPDVENEKTTKPALKTSLPAFVGTKDLFGSSPSGPSLKRPAENSESREEPKRLKEDQLTVPKKSSLEPSEPSHRSASVDPQFKVNSAPHTGASSEGDSSNDERESSEDVEPESIKVNASTQSVPKRQTVTTPSVSSTSRTFSGVEENITEASNSQTKLAHKSTTPSSAALSSNSSTSAEESETSEEDEEEEEEEEEEKDDTKTKADVKASDLAGSKQTNSNEASRPRPPQPSVSDAVKQQQDNQKRLAALEQRKKEAEQQKKLIQGALSQLDTPNANKGKHIVFDSDDEVSDDEEAPAPQKKTLFEEGSESDEEDGPEAVETQSLKEKKCKKAGGSKLFDSSEDEDDDDDDDTEQNRFQIKPQFEGKAGQKLMELQARFGTDPRFQMDAKFLEDNEEEEEQDAESHAPAEQELAEEKKKNMAILQNVLNVSIQPSDASKKSAKGKTFRDISALHYDPTSDAHAAFETKTEAQKKESKAARRKKREEAEKLPEVSKEIYYDVAVDLKEVFGSARQTEKEELSWDKKEDDNNDDATGEDAQMSSLFSVETGNSTSSGFTFSFFGDDSAKETTTNTDEYKIEILKGAKVSWQADPRFQDSSSDEEEVEEDEENQEQTASTTVTTEETAPKKTFFFFHEGDMRLKEGPRMFYRSQKLGEQREAWEEKRAQLKEEYRKKHKDARRRHKATMRN